MILGVYICVDELDELRDFYVCKLQNRNNISVGLYLFNNIQILVIYDNYNDDNNNNKY